jgi:hypothetical protein
MPWTFFSDVPIVAFTAHALQDGGQAALRRLR